MNLVQALGYEGNSLPYARRTSSEYSFTEPAVQYSNRENPLIIYDIEISQVVTKEIIQKWLNHSSKCTFLYILIPDTVKTKAEKICVTENIINCILIPYRFETNKKNRSVIIDFPS